ncbi:HetZ-related protein 2 [Chamaesiphon sp. VAR_48_metabat_135_sub]|uniref:HetZ-related protein 2 n=1 Tax=Chamaesiphon sp. VAR_48_metabat_135_sub TaxID=2964699 RepID=UPI00286A3458|nr:HetZ-related protein 2 [Chamaesiphon sp. VAR_48_metabat_135_sub]
MTKGIIDKIAIATQWEQKIALECSGQNATTQKSILNWVLGENSERLETLDPEHLKIADRAMDYRLRILIQRYLGLPPERAYKNLMQRLGGLAVLRDKIRAWLTLSNDRQRNVLDVLQEVIQELLQGDKYIQQQIAWIGQCTKNPRLRDTLLFASIEEYCLRPIRNQPLLAHRFINYLRRSQKGGVTNIPQGDLVKLVSDEIIGDSDSTLSLLDRQAQDDYHQQQELEETQLTRDRVKGSLRNYLIENVSTAAGEWLDLYLQGKSPDAIALALKMDIKQVYRLREKINYHTLKVFAIKAESELVSQWLQISLQEHNLGLTPIQWDKFCASLDPKQREIMMGLKAGTSVEAIAKSLHIKTNQVMGEWSQVYLAAQEIRTN